MPNTPASNRPDAINPLGARDRNRAPTCPVKSRATIAILIALLVFGAPSKSHAQARFDEDQEQFIFTHGWATFSKLTGERDFEFFGRNSLGQQIRVEAGDIREDWREPIVEGREVNVAGDRVGTFGIFHDGIRSYVDDELVDHHFGRVQISGGTTEPIPADLPADVGHSMEGTGGFSVRSGWDPILGTSGGWGTTRFEVFRYPDSKLHAPRHVEFHFTDPKSNFLALHVRDQGQLWLSNHGTETQFPTAMVIDSPMEQLVPKSDADAHPFSEIVRNTSSDLELSSDEAVELAAHQIVKLDATYRNSAAPDLIAFANPDGSPIRILDQRPWITQPRFELREDSQFWLVNPKKLQFDYITFRFKSSSSNLAPADPILATPIGFPIHTPSSYQLTLGSVTGQPVEFAGKQELATGVKYVQGAPIAGLRTQASFTGGFFDQSSPTKDELNFADRRESVAPLSIQDRGDGGVWIYNAGDEVRAVAGLELYSESGVFTPREDVTIDGDIEATDATPFDRVLGNRANLVAFRSVEPVRILPGSGVWVAQSASDLALDDLTLATLGEDDIWYMPSLQRSVYGDFDGDQLVNATDIDLLAGMLDTTLSGDADRRYDLNADSAITGADRDILVSSILGTSYGDATLDGAVDFADFLRLSHNFGEAGTWSSGDFDGDGRTEFSDFLLLSANFGASTVATVPEPSSCALFLIGVLAAARRRNSS